MNRHLPRTITTAKLVAVVAAAALSAGACAGVAGTLVMSSRQSASIGNSASGFGGGANTTQYDYSGSYSAASAADGSAKSETNTTISSTTSDQNVALAENGGTMTVTGSTLTKTGDGSSDDNDNFYGTNAISLTAGSKSKSIISGSELTATSSGSNGIFATDSGTAYANDTTITTSADNSRGLDATYGGTIIANAITASTKGDHSATVATDRGGGSVSLSNSKLSTAGSGSPLLYSTGDVQVNQVTGTASNSQIAGMEGYNTILINNSTLKSTNTSKTASDPISNGIIIYQSTSGDAESSTSEHATFQAKDSTLSSAITSGSMFYFTNTTADVVLSNTTLDFDSAKASLINASGNDSNSWGEAGSNGATVNFTGRNQTLEGTVTADTISTVNMYLLDGTTWTGKANITKNTSASSDSTSDAPITVNIDGSSTWTVTADTTISALNVAKGGKVVDSDGKTVTIVANGKTVATGDSDITVTVTGAYTTTVDAGDDTELSTEVIDRSAFDTQFDTTTTWSMA
jgi:hypothetical protein